MRAFPCALMLALLAAPTSAWSGEAARCRHPPTLADNVAAAPVIVVARARSRTRRLKNDELRTRFVVDKVLKGHPTRRRIAVEDCWGWKCASWLFRRGQRAVLFLSPVTSLRAGAIRRGRYSLPGLSCRGGFHIAALPYPAPNPRVREIVRKVFALTGHPLPPRSHSKQ